MLAYANSNSASDSGNPLGVVAMDVLLDQLQETMESIVFISTGYSILATADEGTVLAAPTRLWDRDPADEDVPTVCGSQSTCIRT